MYLCTLGASSVESFKLSLNSLLNEEAGHFCGVAEDDEERVDSSRPLLCIMWVQQTWDSYRLKETENV